MPKKINIDERAVIERYEECETARIVAQEFGVSSETIYRILKRNGIQRTHRHSKNHKKELVSNCRSKYCPALVVMLRTVCNLCNKEICNYLDMKPGIVGNIISRHKLTDKRHRRDVDIDALESEYLTGVSMYELGEKYNVHPSTISKWMRQRGHKRGKGYSSIYHPERYRGRGKVKHISSEAAERRKQSNEQTFLEKFNAKYKGAFTCVEYKGRHVGIVVKCNICGSVFERRNNALYFQLTCNECRARAAKQKQEEIKAKKQTYIRLCKEELKKDKICKRCGKHYHSESPTSKYCSKRCQKRANARACNHRQRARKYGVAYESGITLEKLIERDGLTCKICGGQCNLSDRTSTHVGLSYPTIDHIIAMKNGGGHTWDNVQIAHMICNSTKQDLMLDELTEEVIEHAKEQAITNKCA